MMLNYQRTNETKLTVINPSGGVHFFYTRASSSCKQVQGIWSWYYRKIEIQKLAVLGCLQFSQNVGTPNKNPSPIDACKIEQCSHVLVKKAQERGKSSTDERKHAHIT